MDNGALLIAMIPYSIFTIILYIIYETKIHNEFL